jgi:hypothetical protein
VCAPHVLQLLADPGVLEFLTPLFARQIAAAAEWLRRGQPPQQRDCVICVRVHQAEQSVIARIVTQMTRHSVDGRDLADVVLCREHALAVTQSATRGIRSPAAGRAGALIVTETLRDRLQAATKHPTMPRSVAMISRADKDAPRRAAWASTVEAVAKCQRLAADAGVIERLHALLDAQSCPLCASAAAASCDYVGWLTQRPPDGQESDLLLCPRHLHDAAAVEGTGAWVVRENARFWDRRIGAFLRAVKGQPNGRVALRRAVVALAAPPGCGACRAEADAVRRAWALLRAGLADRWTRELLDASHGVCLIHGAHLPSGDPLGALLRARVALAEWELDEAVRHSGPAARHEYRGTEMSAWLRAPTLLDGAIYCGCAAPATGVTPSLTISETAR